MKLEELLELLKKGENQQTEFKAKASGIGAEICAFANAEGGTVLVGVSDDGSLVGASPADEARIQSELQALAPVPKVEIEKTIVNGKPILAVRVKRSEDLVSIGPNAYIRIGKGKRPLLIPELLRRAAELAHVDYDMLPSSASAQEVERKYVGTYLEKRKTMRGIEPKGGLRKNLEKLKIVVEKDGKKFLSVGGLLFFTRDPQKHMPNTRVRVVEFSADEKTLASKDFTGPLWKIVDDVWEFLARKFKTVSYFRGMRRLTFLEYPKFSIREALINAMAHRNYAVDADVRVFIHPDRLAIRNPGSFPPNITPERPEHFPRNKLICEFFYNMGYIEKYGFGIERMKEECERHPLVSVKFDIAPGYTEVIFEKKLKAEKFDEIDEKILALLKKKPMKSSELSRELGISKPTVVNRLSLLVREGLAVKRGRGPATTYHA
jgi:ATP-dependent DNA helicase RecG